MSAIYPNNNNNNTYSPVLTPQQPLIQQTQQPLLQQPLLQQPQQYYYATPLITQPREPCKEDKHKSDRAYSVTFFVLGFFMFFPFFFNLVYLKSPHCYARKIALASLIIGSLYLCAGVINFSIFYLAMTPSGCWEDGSNNYFCN